MDLAANNYMLTFSRGLIYRTQEALLAIYPLFFRAKMSIGLKRYNNG